MKIRNRKSVFFRYICIYFTAITVLLALVFPIYRVALDGVRKNVVNDYSIVIEQGVAKLKKSFESVMRLDYKITDSDYMVIKQMSDGLLAPPDYVKLRNAHRIFSSYALSVDIASEIFVVFKKSSFIMSTASTYISNVEFFEKFMIYQNYSSGDMYSILSNNTESVRLLPLTPIKSPYFSNSTDVGCITFVAHNSGSPVNICAVYKLSDIESLFNMPMLPGNAFIEFIDTAKTNILSTKNDISDDEYFTIEQSVPSLDMNIIIGIPYAYIDEQMRPVRNLINNYLYLLIIVSVILVVALSLYAYLPIYKLVKDTNSDYSLKKGINEFQYLRDLAKQSSHTNRSLNNMLSSMRTYFEKSILINALLSKDLEAALYEQINDMYYLSNEPCRIALLDIGIDLSKEKAVAANSQIHTALAVDGLRTLRINDTQTIILFEDKKRLVFESALTDIDDFLKKNFSASISTVVSGPFFGSEHMHEAYVNLQISIMNTESFITYLDDVSSDDHRHERMTKLLQAVHALSQAISMGGICNVENIFKTAISKLGCNGEDLTEIAEVFYYLRSAPAMFICEHHAKSDMELPIFDYVKPISTQFDRLCEICVDLARNLQCPENTGSYKQKLMIYINDKYKSPDIYATHVADAFKISTKQVCRIVREYTGMGFSDYLDSLRMKNAAELLTSTDDQIATVARRCGYNIVDTFYKAFKKTYGIAPSKYRK